MKVGYSKTYPILVNGQWEKIWLEDEIASGSDEETRKALYSLKKQVENFHYESTKAAEKQMGTQVVDATPVNRTGSIIRDISTVKDFIVLDSYKLIAKTHPDIQQAYDNKLKELQ